VTGTREATAKQWRETEQAPTEQAAKRAQVRPPGTVVTVIPAGTAVITCIRSVKFWNSLGEATGGLDRSRSCQVICCIPEILWATRSSP